MRAGNWTPAAEFNIWVDPEAARIVFRSGLPITMCGLDVTHKALFGLPEIDRMRALGTRAAGVFADLLLFFTRFHLERYGTADTPIHDAVAVAAVALPELVTTHRYHVDVAVDSDITRGRTVVDDRGSRGSRRTWRWRWTSTGARSQTCSSGRSRPSADRPGAAASRGGRARVRERARPGIRSR